MPRAPETGPMLFFRRAREDGLEIGLTALVDATSEPPVVEVGGTRIEPSMLAERCATKLWRWDLDLPVAPDAGYRFDGAFYPVRTDMAGDLDIAFVSCNGQEHGDLDRPAPERNVLWQDLRRRVEDGGISLLLHGGDQVYADEVTLAHPQSKDWPDEVPHDLTPDQVAEVTEALRDAFYMRYATQWAQDGFAQAVARVPSLCMWDDHDICDGWGSLREELLDSAVGKAIFEAARESFLLFQFGCAGDERPSICIHDGPGYDWSVALPGVTLIAPDLRSTRRPERVMDQTSWMALRSALDSAGPGQILVVSTVPALGPRLSLVETVVNVTGILAKYSDDLRDQWQSRMHRQEWRDFLSALISADERPDRNVALLSGEIHLATYVTMSTEKGEMQQFVASGITHPAPPMAYARSLGALARLGETPLPGHKIKFSPLPGQSGIYTAERNFLRITRKGDDWQVWWELEDSGPTEPIAL